MPAQERATFTWRFPRQINLYDKEFGGSWRDIDRFTYLPDGHVTSERLKVPNITLEDPSKPLVAPSVYVPLLSAGRGFSRIIDQIESVTNQASGEWLVEATGRFGAISPCRWQFTVIPDAGYLVVAATAKRADDGRVVLSLTTDGIVKTPAGSHPARSVFHQSPDGYGPNPEGKTLVEFVSFSVEPDIGLIQEATRLLRGEFPKGADVIDLRRSGMSNRTIVGESPIGEKELQAILSRGVDLLDIKPSTRPADQASVPADAPGSGAILGTPAGEGPGSPRLTRRISAWLVTMESVCFLLGVFILLRRRLESRRHEIDAT